MTYNFDQLPWFIFIDITISKQIISIYIITYKSNGMLKYELSLLIFTSWWFQCCSKTLQNMSYCIKSYIDHEYDKEKKNETSWRIFYGTLTTLESVAMQPFPFFSKIITRITHGSTLWVIFSESKIWYILYISCFHLLHDIKLYFHQHRQISWYEIFIISYRN